MLEIYAREGVQLRFRAEGVMTEMRCMMGSPDGGHESMIALPFPSYKMASVL
jgi:hypothetical protein